MGTYQPYSPMRGPEKHVTLEDMAAIFAKRGQKFELKPFAPKVARSEPVSGLKWKRLSDTSIQASTGPVILKTLSSDSPPRDIFVVFSGSSLEGPTAQVLARFFSSQDAKDFVRLLPPPKEKPNAN